MPGSVLRLVRFRPEGSGAALDAHLRESLVPRLARLEGRRHVYLGRHGPGEAGERLIVSVWESDPAMVAGIAGPDGSGDLDVDLAGTIAPVTEILPIAVDLTFAGADGPGILRVFRGRTRPGLLDEYVGDVRSGTIADVQAGQGPLALFLGLAGPDSFVTVSVWTGWDVVEAATGANLRRPVATRHANRLVEGGASHYEVLAEAVPDPTRTRAT